MNEVDPRAGTLSVYLREILNNDLKLPSKYDRFELEYCKPDELSHLNMVNSVHELSEGN